MHAVTGPSHDTAAKAALARAVIEALAAREVRKALVDVVREALAEAVREASPTGTCSRE